MKLKWKLAISINVIFLILLCSIGYFAYSQISYLVNLKIEDELYNSSRLGLALLEARYPGTWTEQGGKLAKGTYVLNDDNTVVDTIKNETGNVATIFSSGTRIATSIKDEHGNRITGTKANPEVVETVLVKGGDYIGTTTITANCIKRFILLSETKAVKSSACGL